MDKFIGFKPQDATLPGYIRFSVTKKAFEKINPDSARTLAQLQRFSASRVLLILAGKHPGTYEVFTADGTYFCKITDDETALLITSFYPNSLRNQNNALKNGVCFQVRSGIIIQIKLTAPYDIYYDIANGKRMSNNAYSETDVRPSLRLIAKHIGTHEDEKTQPTQPEEVYQPKRKLAKLLQVSENYSVLSSALEERNAAMLRNVPYFSIKPIEFDRVDRVAYEFEVQNLDEKAFKEGAQVEVEDIHQEKQAAEIRKLVKDNDGPATAMHLLFNQHIDISEFNQVGWFSLSFSTVNKDVQLSANEAIRTGKANAKYMDVVFGDNASNGFEHKNLSNVKEALAQKKYPPNKSQVDAICAGINAKDVFLVMGPPGTGKTTVILEWVKYFVTQEHKRVLVSSQNNKAVDNVLARIADEKDIDVIRIGSESKLQSDVVPYMFENKVKALRQEISQSVQTNDTILEELMRTWSDYCAQLQAGSDLVVRAENAKNSLVQKITEEFAPLYQTLDKLYTKHKTLLERRAKKTDSITSLDCKINRQGKGFFKFLYSVLAIFYKFYIKFEVKQYDALVQSQCDVVRDYNTNIVRYRALYASLYQGAFAQWEALRCEAQRSTERIVQAKPKAQPGNIWGLFETVQDIVPNSLPKYRQMQDIVKTDLDRAKTLQILIGDWKNEVATKQNYALNEIVLESVDLVGATCIGINSQKRFANLDFDITIIDEAGQIQVHNALVPLSVSNKLIMLGDHKQIPPSADQELMSLCEENEVETELLEKSLFEKMYQTLPAANKIMLDTQYRMPAEIADTISDWFYDGAYYSPDFKKGLPSLMPRLSNRPYVIIDTSKAAGRYEQKSEEAGSSNPLEAAIITEIVRYLDKDKVCDMKEVGVISAYKSQVKLIKNKITRILPGDLVNEMVATLDSFQGQERDIILYSFTRSSGAAPNRPRIGFLNELRRLNVAMTRCKKMLILVGDMSFLGGCTHCNTTESGQPIYDKSEKQFADFINKMVNDVKDGRGEIISYQEFVQKMKAEGGVNSGDRR